jgi:deferrochelatase/peroxidase EfeB
MTKLNSLQAIVARSANGQFFTILLFRLGESQEARQFLQRWLPSVPNGATPFSADAVASAPAEYYFLFTWPALSKLLDGHPVLKVNEGREQFESFFTNPEDAPDNPANVAEFGFIGDSAPEKWWDGQFRSDDIELAIFACFADAAHREASLKDLRQSAADAGLTELVLTSFAGKALAGERPQGGVLHFGYADGITRPNIDWADENKPGTVNLRQFVLGYPSKDIPPGQFDPYSTNPHDPGPWRDFATDGCFAGLTWLYQDVARFNTFLHDTAQAVANAGIEGDPQEWLAAKLMGRWRNGSPLARHPEAPPDEADFDDNFGYADDPNGVKCPFTAHIRLVNARDETLSFPNQKRFPDGPPRMQRRGFRYGPWLDGTEDDGQQRGLIGVFLFSRINEQFHTVLRWVQRANFFEKSKPIHGKTTQDSIVANRDVPDAFANARIPLGDGDHIDVQLQNFVRFKGVKSLFVPSMASLSVLAGRWS